MTERIYRDTIEITMLTIHYNDNDIDHNNDDDDDA